MEDQPDLNPAVGTFDCVVIGGGPAGLSAALVLGRSRRRVVLIDAGEPINRTVEHSHGFFTRDGASPAELARIGREQLAPYDVTLIDGFVTSAARTDAGFDVRVDTGRAISASRMVLASGMRVDLPELPGLAASWGKGAATCPYCHGWEVRDQPLGVLALDADRARHLAVLLTQWSRDITLYAQGLTIPDAEQLAARGVRVEERVVVALDEQSGAITGVRLDDGTTSACGGIFLGAAPSYDSTLIMGLGADLDPATGWPVADAWGRTSVDGLWVAGNAASPMFPIGESAASGARSAMMINAEWVLGAG